MRGFSFALLIGLVLALVPPVALAMDEKALNDQTRAQLRSLGDDGFKARVITHWAYPERGVKSVSRKGVRRFLKERDYAVQNTATDKGLMFEQTQTPASAGFDRETLLLRDMLARNGWFYDGWESIVVTK